MVAPVESTLVEPLFCDKLLVAAKPEDSGHIAHSVSARSEISQSIPDADGFLHMIQGDELEDTRIGPDCITKVTGVIDGDPEPWSVDSRRVIDSQGQYSTLVETSQIVRLQRRSATNQERRISPIQITQKDIVTITCE
jgi:hypothetical protein